MEEKAENTGSEINNRDIKFIKFGIPILVVLMILIISLISVLLLKKTPDIIST